MIVFILLFQYLIAPANWGNFLFDQSSAVFYNPAMLNEKFTFSALYGELYSIPNLNFFSSCVSFRRMGFGAQVINSDDLYVSSINLGYSLSLQDRIKIGISGELRQVFIEGEPGVSSGFSMGAGFIVPYGKALLFGISLHNVVVTDESVNETGEIAVSSKMGILNDLMLYFDIFYNAVSNVSYRFLMEYPIWRNLKFTLGLRSSPVLYNFGISFRSFVNFSYIVSLHPYLGLSHFFSLQKSSL